MAEETYTEVTLEVPEGTYHPKESNPEECRTSCSLAKHPIPPFTERDFETTLLEYGKSDPEASTPALEKLLFYAARTKGYLEDVGVGELSKAHQKVLRRELERDALVALRLIDERGEVYAQYGPEKLPFGQKQHLAPVGEELQAMEFNGTVMRTGINYVWSRY